MKSLLVLLGLVLVACAQPALNTQGATLQYIEVDLFDTLLYFMQVEVAFDAQPYFQPNPEVPSFTSFAEWDNFDISQISVTGAFVCEGKTTNVCNEDPFDPNLYVIAVPARGTAAQSYLRAWGDALADAFTNEENTFGWTFDIDSWPSYPSKPNTYQGMFPMGILDKKTQLYSPCVEWDEFWSSNCVFVVVPPTTIPGEQVVASGICDASGNCMNYTILPATYKTPDCSSADLETAVNAISTAIDFDPFQIDNVGQLLIDALEYQAYGQDQEILDCRDLALSLVTLGPSTVTAVTDVCHKPLYNNDGTANLDWVFDPCCNEAVEFYLCCDPRQVTWVQANVAGVQTENFNAACPNPEGAIGALLDLQAAINSIADLCPANGWSDENLWAKEVFGPLAVCLTEVFNKDCATNQDCWSDLCFEGKCVPPFDDVSPAMSACLISQLDPISIRFWLNEFGLTENATPEQFIAAFRNYVYVDTCLGPVQYSNPPETQAACEAIQNCNWNPDLGSLECLAAPGDFCGFCIADDLCWSLSIPSVCVIGFEQATCVGVWVPEWGVCVDITATVEASCPGIWVEGYFDNIAKCAEGLCIGGEFGSTAAECTSTESCSRSCPACNWGNIPSVCLGPATPAECTAVGGFSDGVSICAVITDAATCGSLGWTYGDCTSRSNGDCSSGPFQDILQCYIDTEAPCTNQADCEAQGECSDWVFSSYLDPRSACFKLYELNWNGEPVCDTDGFFSGWQDVKYGCVNPALSVESCNALAASNPGIYTWVTRASDQASCEGPRACWEPARGTWTYKNESECNACSGFYVPIFQWIGGNWRNGYTLPLEWKTKAFVQTNTWGPGIEWSERSFVHILNILLQPIGAKIAFSAKAEVLCNWGVYTHVLQQIADECGTDAGTGRKRQTANSAKIAEFRAWSNTDQAFDAGRVYLVTSQSTITSNDYSDITVYADNLASVSSSSNKRILQKALNKKRQDISLTPVVEVVNDDGYIIGQALSDGYTVNFAPLNDGSYELCISLRTDIEAACTGFTVPDLATGSPLMPLDVTVTSRSDGTSVCAQIPPSGNGETYFAIWRVNNWESATEDACDINGGDGGDGGDGDGGDGDGAASFFSLTVVALALLFSLLM